MWFAQQRPEHAYIHHVPAKSVERLLRHIRAMGIDSTVQVTPVTAVVIREEPGSSPQGLIFPNVSAEQLQKALNSYRE